MRRSEILWVAAGRGVQRDPERGAGILLRSLYENFAIMVGLDNAFGQCQAESPSPIFCGKAGFKDHGQF